MSHVYELRNTSRTPIKLFRAVNGKPCCGEVQMQPAVLRPGDRASLSVTLRVGQSIGPLTHLAFVETDCPDAPSLGFQTTADVLPPVRIEQTGAESKKVFPDAEMLLHFTAYSYAKVGGRPLPLGDTDLESKLGIAWDGRATERALEGVVERSRPFRVTLLEGVVERSRPFRVTLKAGLTPGLRSDVIILRNGQAVALECPLLWEVLAAIKALPAGLVLRSDAPPKTTSVLIRALDGRGFRVEKVESSLPGIVARSENSGLKPVHAVRVEGKPGAGLAGRSGDIVITTDHPDQPLVKIAVFVSGASPAIAHDKGDTP